MMAIAGLGNLLELGVQATPGLVDNIGSVTQAIDPSFLSQVGTGISDAAGGIADFGADSLDFINQGFGTTAVDATGNAVTSGGLGNLANIGLQGFGAVQGFQNAKKANERADAQLAQQQEAFQIQKDQAAQAASLNF